MGASVNRVFWSRKTAVASGVQTNALAVEVRAVWGDGDPAVVFDEAPVEISKTQKGSIVTSPGEMMYPGNEMDSALNSHFSALMNC